jgi:hypothetical protein
MNTAGFYSYQSDELLYAPERVQLPTGLLLLAEQADQHSYPQEGWTWFESRALAQRALVPIQDES